MADHEKRIAQVDKNVLNVECRKDAIGYFAKKYDVKSNKQQKSVSSTLLNALESVVMKRNNKVFNAGSLSVLVDDMNSRSRDKSDRKDNKEYTIMKQLRKKGLLHHEKLSKQNADKERDRSTFLRFMNQGESSYSQRQFEEQKARLNRCEVNGS